MRPNCAEVQSCALDIARGDHRFDDHLAACRECAAYVDDVRTIMSSLRNLPEIEPGPRVFARIRSDIGEAPTVRSMRVWKTALAAAVLVAGFLGLLALTNRTADDPLDAVVSWTPTHSTVKTGQTLASNTTYTFDTFVTITLADVGSLRVREGTRLQFRNKHHLVLEAGEIVAEISRGPFKVATSKLEAAVLGTRFGVRVGEVYVIEGRVQVSSPSGRVVLEAGRKVTDEGRPHAANLYDELAWLLGFEPVNVQLALVGPSRHKAGAKVQLRLTNTSRILPVYLTGFDSTSTHLQLKLVDEAGKEFSVRLERVQIVRAVYEQKLIRMDPAATVEMGVILSRDLFPKAGRFRATFAYTSGGHVDRRVWIGSVETEPFQIEVDR